MSAGLLAACIYLGFPSTYHTTMALKAGILAVQCGCFQSIKLAGGSWLQRVAVGKATYAIQVDIGGATPGEEAFATAGRKVSVLLYAPTHLGTGRHPLIHNHNRLDSCKLCTMWTPAVSAGF